MSVESFEQLEVWQKAHAMSLQVYKLTEALPADEELGLILRMREAALNVPVRIADGFSRRQLVAKLALYREARAAVEVLRYYLILCKDLGYTIDYPKLAEETEALARMVGGLVGSIARRDFGDGRGGFRRGGGGRGRDNRGRDNRGRDGAGRERPSSEEGAGEAREHVADDEPHDEIE